MNKDILIIGGGIIGLCTAYFLQKEGYKVRVFDKGNMDDGASYVNAGYISPSHMIPLSAPGVMKKGIKWMFNSSSPLYIKPRLQPEFLKWAWAFNKSCNQQHVDRAVPIIREFSVIGENLFREIIKEEDFTCHYQKKGLLVLCQTEKMIEEEHKLVKLVNQQGLGARVLSATELQAMEPEVTLNVLGGSIYDCDSHSTPSEFMIELKNTLIKAGVEIVTNEGITDIILSDGSIKEVHTTKQKLTADEVVLTAGAWTKKLCKQLGVSILLEAGKGYCINSEREMGIKYPAIIAEPKIAITPMHGFTRFAGTMEFSGINQFIRKERVEAIAQSVNSVYPGVVPTPEEKSKATSGLRPVSPDGLPFVGRTSKCKNLTIATGHAMLGWTQGPGTGKLVAEIIGDKKTSMSIDAFAPERKF